MDGKMNGLKMLREYKPGEYCEDTCCRQYNNGEFSAKCNNCSAFIYYKWLKDNGYRLLIVEITEQD